MVSNYCQLISEEYGDKIGTEGKQYVEFAVEGAKRMKGLIDDLLEYSRIGAAGLLECVDMNEVLEEAIKNLSAQILDYDADIKRDTLPQIEGNRMSFVGLFQNLLSNGLKYSRRDLQPKLQVTVTEKGAQWIFAVSDNGIGIRQEHFDRIFVIFQRLHPRTEYPGTGLGLAICKKVVEAHGGKIWVESTMGSGSTFYFSLPKRIEEAYESTETTH